MNIDDVPRRNEVLLVGAIPAPAEERTMPSGDVFVTFRLVVARPPSRGAGVRAPTIDTIDCVAQTTRTRRAVLAWVSGDVVEVTGSLRRRFWRMGGGAASRTEVVVATAKRVRAAT